MAGVVLSAFPRAGGAEPSAWDRWCVAFLDRTGRVVDELQQGASHSEGQGYGLLLAEAHGDLAAFERIEAWTRAHLLVRRDALMGWRWVPGSGVGDWHVASDGDLFRAWALIRAARRFGRPEFLEDARRIARDLAAICAVADPRDPARLLLLPSDSPNPRAARGRVTVNPSYLMPRALGELSSATETPRLGQIASDGIRLIEELAARGPVPDWVEIGEDGFGPAPNRRPGSAYDALRIPLYLIWSGHGSSLPVQKAAVQLGSVAGQVIVARDASGQEITTSDLPGYHAISALTACAGGNTSSALPKFDPRQPYYPATLHLLAALAATEAATPCGSSHESEEENPSR